MYSTVIWEGPSRGHG